MRSDRPATPNPGSQEAVKLGCQCPVLDNAHGRGVYTDPKTGDRQFWISAACNLHSEWEMADAQ